jgi:tRNA nucleotidyltransferase (CCA-adding enzyme)
MGPGGGMIAEKIPVEILGLLRRLNQKGDFWLVGGCVRDAMMGRKPKDFDIVTTTPEAVEAMGLQQIGKDFPVWQTQEAGDDGMHTIEIASARTERKVGEGHRGFTTEVTRSVEEDLLRRDLTVNAMAWRPGDFRDPWGGMSDLEERQLRPVSAAFAEDPLRVFRVARFASQLGFNVHWTTYKMILSLAQELSTLPKDRVREELMKALRGPSPELFFRVLGAGGCLGEWFPEVLALKGCGHSDLHHPEGDAFEHTMWVLRKCRELGGNEVEMLCALGHDFGKPLCPVEKRPSYHNHEALGAEPIGAFCRRLGLGPQPQQAMTTVSLNHMHMHHIQDLRPKTLIGIIKQVRRGVLGPDGFGKVCQSDHCGRGETNWGSTYNQRAYLNDAVQALKGCAVDPAWTPVRIENEQINHMKRWKKEYYSL